MGQAHTGLPLSSGVRNNSKGDKVSKVGRSTWVAKEPSNIINGGNYRKQIGIHSRLKRENRAIDNAWRQARKTWTFVPPANMTVTLHKDTGSIPAGLILSVPQSVGAYLLMKRAARILESNDVEIDAVIEGSYEDAVEALGLGTDPAYVSSL